VAHDGDYRSLSNPLKKPVLPEKESFPEKPGDRKGEKTTP